MSLPTHLTPGKWNSRARIRTAGEQEQRHRKLDEVLDRPPFKLEDFREGQEQLQSGMRQSTQASMLFYTPTRIEIPRQSGMRQLAQASMQRWAESAGTASPPSACPNCGYWMRHRSLIQRAMVTLHGVIGMRRPRRRCDLCGQESYRHDEEMCFAWHGGRLVCGCEGLAMDIPIALVRVGAWPGGGGLRDRTEQAFDRADRADRRGDAVRRGRRGPGKRVLLTLAAERRVG